MSWTAIVVLAAAAALALGALVVWAAQAFWVHLISSRWNAMCSDDKPIRKP